MTQRCGDGRFLFFRLFSSCMQYSSRLFLNFDRGIALASIKSSEWAIRR